MDCRVVVEAAVPVYDVETADEAVRIAISKTGEMLNPDLNYVEIEMGSRTTPGGEELQPAFIAADEALVALELEMTVFNVDRDEHASRIARKEIGQRLTNIPLKVLEVEDITAELAEEAENDDDEADDDEADDDEVDDTDTATDADDADEEEAPDVEDDTTDASDDTDTDSVPDETGSDDSDSDTDDSKPATDDPEPNVDDSERNTDDSETTESTIANPAGDEGDGDLLPEFEEIVDE